MARGEGGQLTMTPDKFPCFKCEHSDAWQARKEVIDVILALMHGDTPPAQRNGDLPDACCRRRPQSVN
jgi:hypothetical protein